jgi:Holliday junction resolvasome RuvABC endonuclease subunit
MGYIYAFDLSLSCTGVTIFSNEGVPILIESFETKSEKQTSGKLKLIADKVLELKEKYEPEKIILEGCFTRFNTSTQQIYRVHGLINYLFWEFPQIYFQPMSVKKQVGGRGNMKKDEIQKIILEKYPDINFENTDQSDAFSVGLCYFIKEGVLKND